MHTRTAPFTLHVWHGMYLAVRSLPARLAWPVQHWWHVCSADAEWPDMRASSALRCLPCHNVLPVRDSTYTVS